MNLDSKCIEIHDGNGVWMCRRNVCHVVLRGAPFYSNLSPLPIEMWCVCVKVRVTKICFQVYMDRHIMEMVLWRCKRIFCHVVLANDMLILFHPVALVSLNKITKLMKILWMFVFIVNEGSLSTLSSDRWNICRSLVEGRWNLFINLQPWDI